MIFLTKRENLLKTYLSLGGKNGLKGRLDAVTLTDILNLFAEGHYIFLRANLMYFNLRCL